MRFPSPSSRLVHRVLLVALVCVLCGLPSVFAQTAPTQRAVKILGVSVEGAVSSDPTTIILTSGLKPGDELVIPSDQTMKSINQLWAMKLFSSIEIVIDKEVGDGVYLKIVVQEYPRLETLVIRGNDELSEDDIRGKVGMVRGQLLRPQDFDRIRVKLRKAYEEKGYLLATIRLTTEADTQRANRAHLIVDIDEGEEVSVQSIAFEGNEAFSDGDLRGAMEETSEKQWWKFWSSASFDAKKYEKDKELVLEKYREAGYLDAEILSDTITYNEDKDEMSILLRVAEGRPYYVRSLAWVGNTVFSDSVLSDRLGLEKGGVFNQKKMEENLRGNREQSDVASLYMDRGYLAFNYQPEIQRVGADSVDLRILINERNQFRIGHVWIKGNTKTDDKVIRRVLYTWPGDYFSRSAIIRSIRELATLNYFNPESIKPEPMGVNDSTVDVMYSVEERSSDTFNASIGYSGTFGATGAVGLTFNNFSLARPLAGGSGQILNLEWQFGEAARFRILSLSFTEPWFMDTPTAIGFSIYDERQQYNFDLRRTGISLNLGRRMRWPDDFVRADWYLRYQSLNVINGGSYYDTGVYDQVSFTQVLSRNSLDSPIFPSSGSKIALTTEISGGPLPGSVDYHKHNLELNWFTPLLSIGDQPRMTLYTGAEFGFIKGFQSDSYIPPIEYFYMGGNGLQIQTKPLRGYEDRSVGPTVRGLVRGGRAFARYVAELRFALTLNPMPVYVLGFAEAGNTWLNEQLMDPFDLKRSAGFGARLLIQGVGLIGFDYGYGFDDVEPKDGKADGWHFHFQFGRGF